MLQAVAVPFVTESFQLDSPYTMPVVADTPRVHGDGPATEFEYKGSFSSGLHALGSGSGIIEIRGNQARIRFLGEDVQVSLDSDGSVDFPEQNFRVRTYSASLPQPGSPVEAAVPVLSVFIGKPEHNYGETAVREGSVRGHQVAALEIDSDGRMSSVNLRHAYGSWNPVQELAVPNAASILPDEAR